MLRTLFGKDKTEPVETSSPLSVVPPIPKGANLPAEITTLIKKMEGELGEFHLIEDYSREIVNSFISIAYGYPASENMHHTGHLGLIEHSLSVAVRLLSEVGKECIPSVLPPGEKSYKFWIEKVQLHALLVALGHDLGKVVEWEVETAGFNFNPLVDSLVEKGYSLKGKNGITYLESPRHSVMLTYRLISGCRKYLYSQYFDSAEIGLVVDAIFNHHDNSSMRNNLYWRLLRLADAEDVEDEKNEAFYEIDEPAEPAVEGEPIQAEEARMQTEMESYDFEEFAEPTDVIKVPDEFHGYALGEFTDGGSKPTPEKVLEDVTEGVETDDLITEDEVVTSEIVVTDSPTMVITEDEEDNAAVSDDAVEEEAHPTPPVPDKPSQAHGVLVTQTIQVLRELFFVVPYGSGMFITEEGYLLVLNPLYVNDTRGNNPDAIIPRLSKAMKAAGARYDINERLLYPQLQKTGLMVKFGAKDFCNLHIRKGKGKILDKLRFVVFDVNQILSVEEIAAKQKFSITNLSDFE
ncbi:TraI domain-containing protein [Geotalea sp. SG265]|uniref:TraI domain-containing protein n=1 Tax=Geotalea sp. SG265 TaxID=2922867 RepID=UPI001FB0277E|nr:TraI domain-containing protein [Geotalea sp. SG265]